MANRADFIKTFVTNNWGIKLAAFMLALLTFFAIRSATNDETTLEIPITVEVDKGIAILDQDPPTTKVTFRGSFDDLRRMDASQIQVVVRPIVSDVAGTEIVNIQDKDIKGAISARPVSIVPNEVHLSFDREAEKQFPVAKPATIGAPLIGKVEIEYEPKVVTIRGPERQLQRMLDENIAIETAPVDVDERVKSFSKIVQVISPGKTWVSQIEPSQIKVTANIVTETISREWTNVLVLAVMSAGKNMDVQITPKTVNVAVRGRAELVKNIRTEAMKVYVDCAGLSPRKMTTVPVNVHIPSAIDVTVQVIPDKVDVTIGVNSGEQATENFEQGND